ncbi:MAG: COX15/CtaA family protein, partial [Planctomycetota bacterium]
GMAVPDWPSTYGYNLLLYPWQTWFFGPWDIFIEHGHRLLGAAVGFIAIGLVAVTWRCDRRPWMLMFALSALALVIFQGILGGQRVLQNAKQLAQLHGVVGPTFLALATAFLVASSRFWQTAGANDRSTVTPRISWFAWCGVALAWMQLVLGSQLRHADGFTSPALFGWALKLHVTIAFSFALFAVGLAIITYRHRGLSYARPPGSLLGVLVGCQVLLGISTWIFKYGWPAMLGSYTPATTVALQADSMIQSTIVTTHQAVGALILATSVFLAMRATRFEHAVAPAPEARVGVAT